MRKAWWEAVHSKARMFLPVLLLCLVSLLSVGCGKGQSEVTGTVKYKGKALSFGTVTLMDSDGQMHQGQIDTNGTYSIKDVVSGPAKAIVACVDPNEVDRVRRAAGRGGQRDGHTKGTRPPATGGTDIKSKGSLIPEKYSDFGKSELTVTVEKETTRFDIDLK